jgi:FAD/FMN-containing dehydrogenase
MHVVAATNAAEVRAAVLGARERDLPLSVYATGHGTLAEDPAGVQLHTSAMAEVLVDPDRRTARVGPGARWEQVLAAAAPFGLAPLSGSHGSVGVAGYTLGGGMGWLGRRFGLAADSLLRADVVTADGELVRATADRNGDLFCGCSPWSRSTPAARCSRSPAPAPCSSTTATGARSCRTS